MSYYETLNINDTADISGFFGFVNNTVGGLFFPVIIFIIWVVSLLAIKQYSTSRAWTFSSLFCSILSMVLAVLNLISNKFMYFFFILTAIGLVMLKLEES